MVKNGTRLHCKYSLYIYFSANQMDPLSVWCAWYGVWREYPTTRHNSYTSYLLQHNTQSKQCKNGNNFSFASIKYYLHKVSAILNHTYSVANHDRISLYNVYIGRIFMQFDMTSLKMVQVQLQQTHMRFDDHFWPNQQQQQCLPQFESILDGHLSRHFLPAPFRLEIENTT
jgi:hypothetical protein